jgi:hypothetical protein
MRRMWMQRRLFAHGSDVHRLHRSREEALEILARARPGVGLVAYIIDCHVGQRAYVGLRDGTLRFIRG